MRYFHFLIIGLIFLIPSTASALYFEYDSTISVNKPGGIAFDSSNNIYISSQQPSRVYKYNSAGSPITNFTSNNLYNPVGLSVANNKLYVCSSTGGNMEVYNLSGGYLRTLVATDHGGFYDAVTVGTNVYITEYNYNQFSRINTSDQISQMSTVSAGAPYGIAYGNDSFYVSSPNGNTVSVYNSSGTLTTSFTTWDPNGYSRGVPRGLAVDSEGRLYVALQYGILVYKRYAGDVYDLEYTYGWDNTTIGSDFDSIELIAINGDKLYVADNGNNRVQVFNIRGSAPGSDGSVKWRTPATNAGAAKYASVGSDGTIYYHASNQHLRAMNPHDKSAIWTTAMSGTIYSSPSIATDGTLYLRTQSNLVSISSAGAVQWEAPVSEGTAAPTISGDGTVYVAGIDSELYAIGATGTEKWTFTMDASNAHDAPAVGTDGTIYIGSTNTFYAINPSGTKKWDMTTAAFIASPPAIATDGTIYLGTSNRLYAINPADGSTEWEFSTGAYIHASPAIAADGTIYVASNSKLFAVNPNGTEKWQVSLNQFGQNAAPAVAADGIIYVGCDNESLYAINPTGTIKWSITTDAHLNNPITIGPDGTLYTNSSLYLYAIDTDSTGPAASSWPQIGQSAQHASSLGGAQTISLTPIHMLLLN